MKMDLLESGLQNIRTIAKQYNKAMIYYHMDLDGVTSAIGMKEYLKKYGIQTVAVQRIQYGSMEYAITKPKDPTILPVLVDFAHGKVFMKIHTDHHDKQISYNSSSSNFRHSPSNAGTISAVISPSDIFPKEDLRIIDMIDSAGFAKEGISAWDMVKAIFKNDKLKELKRNHMDMGMVAGKLLLAYKNRPNFLDRVVMESGPSLLSMFVTILKIIKEKMDAGERGWVSPEQIDKNSTDYFERQNERKIPDGSIEEIDGIKSGTAMKIGNCVFQIGAGSVRKTGMYDRYTVFRLYPDVKYMVMLWDSLGMIQVSKNPWGESDDGKHLGELVIDDLFVNKYAPKLKNKRYGISLLALKKFYEADINNDNVDDAVGFDYNELIHLFDRDYSKLTTKQQYVIKKWMDWRKNQFTKIDPKINDEGEEVISPKDEKHNKEVDRAISLLNSLKIPLPEIIMKTSGGHPAITNLSGFGFIEEQKRIDRALKNGENPLANKKGKSFGGFMKYDPTSVKIMKSICKDVIEILNQ